MPLAYNLTYGGVPFLLDQAQVIRMDFAESRTQDNKQSPPRKHQPLGDLIDELNRLISFKYLQDFTLPSGYPGKNLGAIAQQWQIGPQPSSDVNIGDWYYPVSASRWSVFRGLASSSQTKAMLANSANGPQFFNIACTPQSPSNNTNFSILTKMHMLPPRPLAEHGGQFDGLFLITLVDERYWWQFNPVSLHVTQTTAWKDLIKQIATALNVTVTVGTIPSAYTSPEPDSQLWCNAECAATLLDAVAYNIGCSVVRGFDGTYSVQNALVSQATIDANRGAASSVVRTAGGDIFSNLASLPAGNLSPSKNLVIPKGVAVSFPKYIYGDDPVPHFVNRRYEQPRPSVHYEDSHGAVHQIFVPLAGSTGSSYIHSVHTTAKALYSAEANIALDPTNVNGCKALAAQIAQDYLNNQIASALDEVYPGIVNWTPEGIHDVIWTYSARTKQAITRVMRSEWNEIIREMQHATVPAGDHGQFVSSLSVNQRGVGGPSVAQTIRDSEEVAITANLSSKVSSTDNTFAFGSLSHFPSQNRWKGLIDDEIILFDGTSGGNSVTIAQRGIDGTLPTSHQNNALVTQVIPSTTYGVNLTTYEKMQFVYPSNATSGGITGVNVVPQLQSVQVLTVPGIAFSTGGLLHYTGQVLAYDPTVKGNPFVVKESIWIVERNNVKLSKDTFFEGQLVGYNKGLPVYAITNIQGVQQNFTFGPDVTIDVFDDTIFNFFDTVFNILGILIFIGGPVMMGSPFEQCAWLYWCQLSIFLRDTNAAYAPMYLTYNGTLEGSIAGQDLGVPIEPIDPGAVAMRLVTDDEDVDIYGIRQVNKFFAIAGQVLALFNQGLGTITFKHNGGKPDEFGAISPDLAGGDKILCPGAKDFKLEAYQGVIAYHDQVDNRWHLFCHNGSGEGGCVDGFTGQQTVVTCITCVGDTLNVVTSTNTYINGCLVSVTDDGSAGCGAGPVLGT